MNGKKALITVLSVALILMGTYYLFSQEEEDPVVDETVEEERSVEEALSDLETVLDMEEELMQLEESQQEEVVEDELFERYAKIEDEFFRIRDDYFEGEISEERLIDEIDELLKDLEKLEEEISSLKGED